MHTLIRQILTSKVYEAAVETPLEEAIGLSRQLNNRILLKREDLQPIFSFKSNSPGAEDYEQLTREFLDLCHHSETS